MKHRSPTRLRYGAFFRLTGCWVVACCLLLPACGALAQTGGPSSDQTAVRLQIQLFGDVMEIEVRDVDRNMALEAIRLAMLKMHSFSAQIAADSPQRGSLGEINRRPGSFVPVTEEVFEFVLHSMRYCLWSGGMQGPLGGEIYRLWDERRQGHEFSPFQLRDAVASADCSTLGLEQNPRRVRIGEGTRLNGFGMERGYAIDLALAELQRHGIRNAIIETEALITGVGPGTSGRGWLVQVPGVEGTRHPIDQLYLRDQSLAWVARTGTDGHLPINQQTGVPTIGVRLVAAVTTMARDAEVLAHSLYAMGHTLGQRHVGSLDPRPSVLWLLGTGGGLPLESPYRWSELDRVREPR
ncbi:MAG: FAD:protein FMN transferase [Thermoanaerobaculia bacterium]|nr:FAD:protein FMN transferase [Thermoanaerobaculia bacterium]